MTTPVLLIPGGAATAENFFPDLPGLLAGHAVVTVDRPGTGRNAGSGRATLAGGAAAWAEALREVSSEPALVVGQSLGGAVAVQLAVDHPDLVAGLVLLDPTPFDDAKLLRLTTALFRVLGLPGRVPVVGPRIDGAMWGLMSRDLGTLTPAARASYQAMVGSGTLSQTAAAIQTLAPEGEALRARLRRLDVPVVLVTADRKPGHRVRAWHEQLADTLGGRVTSWPGCVHAMQLKDPDTTNALVMDVLAEVARRA
jgi:pimeloyl-ACP methyl ester carboxylesterase